MLSVPLALGVSEVSVNATVNQGSQPEQTASGGTINQTKSDTDAFGTRISHAQARLGVLRVYGEARAVTRPQALVWAQGKASFQDDMLIDAPGLTGTTGSVKLKFTIDGTISASAAGAEPAGQYSYARAQYQIIINGSLARNELQQHSASGDPNFGTTSFFLGVEQEYTLSFTYGTPFAFRLFLNASGNAYTTQGGTAISDLSHTATWGGFGEVKDSQGGTVTNYTATSSSGTDYTQPILPPAPVAVSRHLHDGVPHDVQLPLTGDAGVEPRSGGSNGEHQIVLTFQNAITFTGASVTSGTGSVLSASGSGTNVVTINLTGVANAQALTTTLTGVNDGIPTSDIAVRSRFLLGDSNGDSTVNSGDALQTKARSGAAASATTFRSDYNLDGTVNSGDATVTRSRSGTSVTVADSAAIE